MVTNPSYVLSDAFIPISDRHDGPIGMKMNFFGGEKINRGTVGKKIGVLILAELREVNPELRTIHTPVLL